MLELIFAVLTLEIFLLTFVLMVKVIGDLFVRLSIWQIQFSRQEQSIVNTANDTSRVEVLTWGTSPSDSKYYSPIMKIFKGQNPGHGAFVLNLTDTDKHRVIYSNLESAGYPCAEMMQPTGERDKKGKFLEEKRYIIRFSRYPSFRCYENDQMSQRFKREFCIDQERYQIFQELDRVETLPVEMTQKFKDAKLDTKLDTKILEISAESKKQTKLYQFDSGRRGFTHIVHTDRLTPENLEAWDTRNPEASSRCYETTGQSPDRIDNIPLGFGLDVKKLADEMFRVKLEYHKKICAFVFKKENEHIRVKEKEFKIVRAVHPEKIITKDSDITFEELTAAWDTLIRVGEVRTPAETKALNTCYELLKKYESDIHDEGAMGRVIGLSVNCCSLIKDCIRVGLDFNYQGYFTEPFTTNLLATPLELAQEAATLGDLMYQNRNDSSITSKIKGFLLQGRNLNYTFLPSRILIRPALMLVDAIIHIPIGFVKAVYNGLPKRAVKIKSNYRMIESRVCSQHIFDKVVNYQAGAPAFFIDNKTYNEIVENLESIEIHFEEAYTTLGVRYEKDRTILQADITSLKKEIAQLTNDILQLKQKENNLLEERARLQLEVETMNEAAKWKPFDLKEATLRLKKSGKLRSFETDRLTLMVQLMEKEEVKRTCESKLKGCELKLAALIPNIEKLVEIPQKNSKSIKWLYEKFEFYGGFKSDRLKCFKSKYNEILNVQAAVVAKVINSQKALRYVVYNSKPQSQPHSQPKGKHKTRTPNPR